MEPLKIPVLSSFKLSGAMDCLGKGDSCQDVPVFPLQKDWSSVGPKGALVSGPSHCAWPSTSIRSPTAINSTSAISSMGLRFVAFPQSPRVLLTTVFSLAVSFLMMPPGVVFARGSVPKSTPKSTQSSTQSSTLNSKQKSLLSSTESHPQRSEQTQRVSKLLDLPNGGACDMGGFSPEDSSKLVEGSETSTSVSGTAGLWRAVNRREDLFSGFRANASHYWAWVQRHNDDPLFQAKGVVSGDPHILNFGEVRLASGGVALGLIDIDDSGIEAPLFADFLRYWIGNQASEFRVDAKALFDAYRAGVLNRQNHESAKEPKSWRELTANAQRTFANNQKKYIKRMSNQKRFTLRSGIRPVQEAPREVQCLYQQSLPDFKKILEGYRVIDFGFKIRKTGGSQGLPRFWFLVEKDQEPRRILEFKYAAASSVSLLVDQPSHPERLDSLVGIYRPRESEVRGPFAYSVSAEGKHAFLVRERMAMEMNFDPSVQSLSKDLVKKGKEMSIFLAYHLGRWHGGQMDRASNASQNYRELWTTQVTLERVEQMANPYIGLMKHLMANPSLD